MAHDQVAQTEPRIKNPKNLRLPAAAGAILKHMFAGHQRVIIEEELGSGFSGSRIFVVTPVGAGSELPSVIKMAPAGLIEREFQAYQNHIRNRVYNAAEIQDKPVLDSNSNWGALRYHLIGGNIFQTTSLIRYCRHASNRDIWHVLHERLFECFKPLWQQDYASPKLELGANYDRLLPVNLLIEPASLPPDVRPHLLKPGALPEQPLQAGDYVRLERFVITEVDRDTQAVTLDLPPPADDPPAWYRLRLQPVGISSPFRENEVLDSVEGIVTATRYGLLETQVERVLSQDWVSKPLSLPGEANDRLPNPLAALPDILSVTRNVRVAHIHGDLNLENILVDRGVRDVRLIDFAMARQDHVLHDLLRMETGVVTWFLPEVLAKTNLPPETVYDLYKHLHSAARLGHSSVSQKLDPALRKVYVVLTAIRETAQAYLYARTDWDEYYQGLTLYLLGALKFRNLDDVPQAPLPKQVAFWGAAAIQKLLQGPPQSEETTPIPLARLLDDLTGQVLDQYKIIELIGEGSMASVYRAHQPVLEREVAVKVMLPSLATDPIFRQRFEREVRAIAGLRHPNILTVHASGHTDEGRLYLVMDYAQGGNLRKRLENATASSTLGAGLLPLEEVVEIVSQVADALDHAHGQGVIHRDVKPTNILLTRDGCPLLADFGLAKPFRSDLFKDGERVTESGMVLGTPDYMAPEQAEGSEIDGRADIHALGVTLFEMLTGQRPYQGERPVTVLAKLLNEPMPRPSQVNPAVPSALDEVVVRATAKSPDERYGRAGDMADALQRALEEIRAAEKRSSLPPKIPLWAWGAAIAVMVTLLAVVGGVFVPRQAGKVKPTPTVAQAGIPPVTLTPEARPSTAEPELLASPSPTSTPEPATPTPTSTVALEATQTALAAGVTTTLLAEASATAHAFTATPTVTPTPTPTPVPPTATATHTPIPPTPTTVPAATPTQPRTGPMALTIYLRGTLTEDSFVALSADQPNGGTIYREGAYIYGEGATQIGDTV